MLVLDRVSFERDDIPLFSNVSLSVNAGDVIQVVGANGSGKTTLLNIVTTLLDATDGQVLWQGLPIKANTDFLAELLYIGHKPGVNGGLTARENLRSLMSMAGKQISLENIDEALDAIGLYGFEDVPAGQLSAGQQRRIALARLLLSDANVWVLDEPFTALDVHGVSQITALLRTHSENGGICLLTTHQPIELSQCRQFQLAPAEAAAQR